MRFFPIKICLPPPSMFDNGVYSKCTHEVCLTGSENVVVYLKSSDGSKFILDQNTIFQLPIETGKSKHIYLYNRVSNVFVGERAVNGDGFSFRNPVHFMPLIGEMDGNWLWKPEINGAYEAKLETDAVIDYLIKALKIRERVEEQYQEVLSDDVRSVLEAYATGLNYWMVKNPNNSFKKECLKIIIRYWYVSSVD